MSMIKKVFSFIVWGLATTALNVGFFLLFRHMGVPLTPAVILAWFLSVTFSYFANKKMVFQDSSSGFRAILKSMLSDLKVRDAFGEPLSARVTQMSSSA